MMIPNKERLVYRRQFVIGTRYVGMDDWQRVALDDRLCLSVHPDLQVAQSYRPNSQLTLLGYLIDPKHPEWSNEEILHDIHQQCASFEQLLEGAEHCGGRWILLFRSGNKLKLFHDSCGMRQVFYSVQPDGVWCASQAVTLAAHIGAKVDENEHLRQFMQSKPFQSEENLWPGDGTPFVGIKHLPPNHSLDMQSGKVERFWPVQKLQPLALEEAVSRASRMLIGSIEAIARRSEVMLPVTAGWDSRILLAASRRVSKQVHYYITLHPGLEEDSPDVAIPSRLLSRLGLAFHIHPSPEQMDEQFVHINRKNAQMRDLAKTRIIYQHYLHSQGKVNISGNYSEIARECYYDYHPNREVTGAFLARYTKLGKNPFVINSFDAWLNGIKDHEKWGINPLTLFEWEQIFGNWGAIYSAEQDIAIEEFSPFNNRKILTTLLAVKNSFGSRNFLYREMIRQMWPETLLEPINPMSAPSFLRKMGKEALRGGLYYGYQALKKGSGLLTSKRKEETT